MLPPEEHARAASEADYHVQLRIEHVEVAANEARLRGRVVRVFRGPASLRDAPLALSVSCFGAGEVADTAPGDSGSFPVDALRPGAILEAYLNRTPSGAEIAAGLCGIVPGESDAPLLAIAKRDADSPGVEPSRRFPARALLLAAAFALAGLLVYRFLL